jgi:hypothetical protein
MICAIIVVMKRGRHEGKKQDTDYEKGYVLSHFGTLSFF